MPLYVESGLFWQKTERCWLQRYLDALRGPRLEPLVVLSQPLDDLYGDHWSVTGEGVPDASTPDEAVFLPGRNALLSLKPVLWCQLHGVEAVALGVLANNPFADSSVRYFSDFEAALRHAMDRPIRIDRPFTALRKQQVMALGADLPLHLTFSCLVPVEGQHCGRCNKCEERRRAFELVGRRDATVYACERLGHTRKNHG